MSTIADDDMAYQTHAGLTGPTGPSLPFHMAKGGPVPRESGGEVCELLWHNTDALDWAVRDERAAAWLAKDVPAAERERAQRRQLAAKLARGEPAAPAELPALHRTALHRVGEPPLAILRGTVAPCFDPVAELRCWMAVVTPFRDDRKVHEALELGRTAIEHAPHGIELIVWARRRIEDAHTALTERHRTAPREWIEQTLVRQRAYDRCRALGREQLRAMLLVDGKPALSCYLDAAMTDELPLVARFGARLLCRVRAAVESSDGVCGEVMAVARIDVR